MPVSRYVSPFPPFSLTVDEKEELLHVSNEVYAATMAKCEQFRFQDKGRLDPAVWKMVRHQENARVFHNRIPGADTGNRDMHLLVTLNDPPGTLNDAMYGILNPSLEEFRIKTDYVGDTLFDMAVLEPIVLPTPEMPYEYLNLRWAVKRVPLHVRLVSKHTDTVYLEGAGIRHLSNGERVGVHLFHSVTIAQMPALPQYERFNLSLCEIWWETEPGKLASYMTAYFEFKESFKVPFVILSMADACVSSSSATMKCALLKKLSWLVQNKTAIHQTEANSGARMDGCWVCGSSRRSARHGLKSACAICSKYTCNKCRIKRTLSLFAPDGQLLKHEFRFCTPCMTSARHLDGAVIAAEDALRRNGGLIDNGGDHYYSQRYYVPSSSSVTGSVTSSQSGGEMHFPRQRRKASTSSSTKSQGPLSLFA